MLWLGMARPGPQYKGGGFPAGTIVLHRSDCPALKSLINMVNLMELSVEGLFLWLNILTASPK